jgi:hypothetical protein
MASDGSDDDGLLTRLRDLALVDLDALLVGAAGDHYRRLLVTYGEDLEDALRTARGRAATLGKIVAGDPLQLLDAPFATRAQGGGRDAAARAESRLHERAAAARALARLDELAAGLIERLLEADRRRASLP